jgi:uncharacterized protein
VVTTSVALAVTAMPASAHVTIDTFGPVEQGSFAKLGFSVPNERDDAGTVMIRVQMPQDHPIAFVSVQPKAGWEVETTTRTLDEPIEAESGTISEAVDTITWTATGDAQINPGEFDWFWVSAGPLPNDVDSLSFPTVQTYSSGGRVAVPPPLRGHFCPVRGASSGRTNPGHGRLLGASEDGRFAVSGVGTSGEDRVEVVAADLL